MVPFIINARAARQKAITPVFAENTSAVFYGLLELNCIKGDIFIWLTSYKIHFTERLLHFEL